MDRENREFPEEVYEFVEDLKKEVSAIILFGSRARGDYLRDSDYDILVISEDFEKMEFWDRMKFLRGFWELDESLEIFPYTKKEFLNLLEMKSLTALDSLEEGIILYEDESFSGIKAKFEAMKNEKLICKEGKYWRIR
jgi:hypothetical protein